MHLLISVVGLELDSLLAGLVVGPILRSWRERFRFALALGVCDAAATFAGSAWPRQLPEAPTFAVYLFCVFFLALAARHNRGLLYVSPALLSIDNLFGGASTNAALTLGAGSAVMALLALSVTAFGRRVLLARRLEV